MTADLAHRGLITKRAGTTTQPSGYLLNFLRTTTTSAAGTREGVPLRGTPLYLKEAQPDQENLYPEEAQGVPATGTPSDENTAVARRAAAVDIDGVLTLEGTVDRLTRANAKTVDADTMTGARRFLHGYMTKLATDEVRRQGPPHPAAGSTAHTGARVKPNSAAT